MAEILTATSIQDLKERVNQEISRRCYYGNISSAAPDYDTPNSETIVQASEINNNIIEPLNLIDNGLDKESINNPIKYSYINNQLITFEGNSNNNTGCRQACTGFCSTACADMCQGCGTTAQGGTSSTSGAQNGTTSCTSCGSSCSESCGTGCSGCVGGCGASC